MLKKMTIRNFKAIQDMTIEFTPLTVLIGANACGKTSILQALDFLWSVARQDISVFLEQRDWMFSELKSQFDNGKEKPLEIETDWEFVVKGKNEQIHWFFSVDAINEQWAINEKITYSNEELLYNNKENKYKPESLGQFNIQSSLLKIMGFMNDAVFSRLRSYLSSSNNFDLLSPDKMRLPNKNIASTIGRNGMTLAACVHDMSLENREKLNKIVSDFINFEVNIETIQDPFFGSIFLGVSEHLKEKTHISGMHISDGVLRLTAFAAIFLELTTPYPVASNVISGIELGAEFVPVKEGMVLLDEIEDGINPYLTEKVAGLLQTIVKGANRQVIITTHSPIILNYLEPEDIFFLWKDKDGAINGRKMFSAEEMRESLDFLNPGEIWFNYGKDEIISRLTKSDKEENVNK